MTLNANRFLYFIVGYAGSGKDTVADDIENSHTLQKRKTIRLQVSRIVSQFTSDSKRETLQQTIHIKQEIHNAVVEAIAIAQRSADVVIVVGLRQPGIVELFSGATTIICHASREERLQRIIWRNDPKDVSIATAEDIDRIDAMDDAIGLKDLIKQTINK